jgi:hypothetical protein
MMNVAAPLKRRSVYEITRRNNPEDSHFHTRSRENLKYHATTISTESVFLCYLEGTEEYQEHQNVDPMAEITDYILYSNFVIRQWKLDD